MVRLSTGLAIKWHEIDITFLIIKLLDALGFIKLKEIKFSI